MIEGAATLAAINYASAQVVEVDAGILQGANAEIAKGKVNPAEKPEKMQAESNSQQDRTSKGSAGSADKQGRLLDVLG